MLAKTFKFSCEKSTQPEQIRIIGQPNYTPRKESVLEAYVNSEPKWNTTLLSKYLGIHYMQIANKFMDFFHASQVNIHPTCLGFVCYTSWFKRLSETMEYGFYSNFFLDKYHLIIFEEILIFVLTLLSAGNALVRVQRVHKPADHWDITFCTRWSWSLLYYVHPLILRSELSRMHLHPQIHIPNAFPDFNINIGIL